MKNEEKKTTQAQEESTTQPQPTKRSVVGALDLNHDGKVDIQDVITLGLRAPGVRIDREKFLYRELERRHSAQVVQMAIEKTPAQAGIPACEIERIADDIIRFERNCVTGISTALGVPGGAAMFATIPADIIQYYGYMLRVIQKLLYLYGFPQIDTDEESAAFDSETMNMLILCMGVMYGVAGASRAIQTVAGALASGVEKKLLRAALTKGTVYPLVKKIAKWFGINMTKTVFAGFFKKAIPVVGGAVSGGLTYLSFKPCCDKLKRTLATTYSSHLEAAGETSTVYEGDCSVNETE